MNENEQVYSQDEINKLLSAINGRDDESDEFIPAADSRKIKIYDFKRPDRFYGYMDEIKAIHENLARSWSLFLHYNQKGMHFWFNNADTVTYEEFIRSVPSPTSFMIAQGFLDSVPLPLSFVIEVNPNLSTGQSILNEMSKSLLDEYSRIWNNRYNMKLELSLKSVGPKPPQYIFEDSPLEMGVLIKMGTKINDTEGMINIYLPYLFMKPLLPYLPRVRSNDSFDENFKQEEDIMDNRYKSAIETGLDNVKVQVIVELGRAVKTLKEIHETKEGTIMSLDAFAGENVDIFVNNVLFGRGEVVVPGENFGVRFTEIVGQEEKGSDVDRTSDQSAAPNADGELKAEV